MADAVGKSNLEAGCNMAQAFKIPSGKPENDQVKRP
jgi:hypothetical protein